MRKEDKFNELNTKIEQGFKSGISDTTISQIIIDVDKELTDNIK